MPNNEFVIRQFEKEDEKDVYELHIKAMCAVGAYREGPWDEDFKDIESVYINSGGDFLVGTLAGKIVGMVALKKHMSDLAELKRLRVDPDFQGKGSGQAMLNKLLFRATELGFKKLELDVMPVQIPAIGLYEKNGFKKVRVGDRFGFPCIYYEKML